MKPLAVAGIVLAVLGAAMLGYDYLLRDSGYTVIEQGPLRVEQERDRTIPTIAGVIAIIAGLGLAFAGQRRI
jgi:hypothetical protein